MFQSRGSGSSRHGDLLLHSYSSSSASRYFGQPAVSDPFPSPLWINVILAASLSRYRSSHVESMAFVTVLLN